RILTFDRTIETFYPMLDGVEVQCLDVAPVTRAPFVFALARKFLNLWILRRAIIKSQPDVVVSFMDTINLYTLLSLFGRKLPIFVCERSNPHMNLQHSLAR